MMVPARLQRPAPGHRMGLHPMTNDALSHAESNVKFCEVCGSPINRWAKRFCSHQCKGQWHAKHGPPPPNKGKRRAPPWTCIQCGAPFDRARAATKALKYCSNECRIQWQRENSCPIGTVRIYSSSSGRLRAWVKVARDDGQHDWRPRSVLVWKATHGPIPVGHLVHHSNRQTLDDTIDNLELYTRAAHLAEHRSEILGARQRNRAARLADPNAGRLLACRECGVLFRALTKTRRLYCSKKCAVRYRRKTLDNA